MKKRLLIGTALFAAISVFPQTGQRRTAQPAMAHSLDETAALSNVGIEPAPVSPMIGSGETSNMNMGKPAASPSTMSWSWLCGSMNAYGMLTNQQRPLQYNPTLNAVSFIHRKSTAYQPSPPVPSAAEPGVIVAEISSNWGATWDSTCIWANSTDWGRYPGGAIYNPPGNTNISNAYIVGSGPTVDATTFSGSWYASKKLNVFDNVASTATGAQQFYSFGLSTYPPNMPRHAWPRMGFSSTNDGIVRCLGILGSNLVGTTTMRGYAVMTGTFNGVAFDWKIDSILPPAHLKTDGVSKYLSEGQMAWNQAGTVGYVVGIGVMATATLSNKSYQPIVYKMDKTLSSTATWSLIPGIDFNTTFTTIPNHLPARPITYPTVTGDSAAIPFTNDFDVTVDANNNVHIGITFMSGFSDHPDSLHYFTSYKSAINPTESYKWGHYAGWRPYLYDFISDGNTPWKLVVIDSMSSEGPGESPTRSGYGENPWDPTGTGGAKLSVESRIQLGRTPDGQFITFSWAESDSGFTNNAYKWNTLPDIKARMMAVGSGTNMYKVDVGPEQNVSGNDNNVRSRATLHYMSPVTGTALVIPGANGSYTVETNTPFTVTNSSPYSQLTNNNTWYGATRMAYRFPPTNTIGMKENFYGLSASYIYPNPAQQSATLVMALQESTAVEVSIMNTVGQVVRSGKSQGLVGENSVKLDLSGLAGGVYLVNVKAGNASHTKKLIVE